MKHSRHIIIVTTLALFISCGTNKRKTDDQDALKDTTTTNTTTTTTGTTSAATEPQPVQKESGARSADSGTNDKHAILANIDQHLISKPDISNATLTVENTLKDATIIKAYAEVSVLDANDKTLRTSYLILENIQPGDSKAVKIPDVSGGAKITSHIVRLKSDQLTDGETILVGSRYIPK
jgi:hypothetical protein